jgi:hypothetical protein
MRRRKESANDLLSDDLRRRGETSRRFYEELQSIPAARDARRAAESMAELRELITPPEARATARMREELLDVLDSDVAAPTRETRATTPRPSSPKPEMALLCDVACDIVARGELATSPGLRGELARRGMLREEKRRRGGAAYFHGDAKIDKADFGQAAIRANKWGRVNGLVNGSQRESTA